MKLSKHARLLILIVAFVCIGSSVRAEEYVKPNVENIIDTLVRFGALDLSDDSVLDAYAQLMACDVYRDFFKDEFKWQKARPAIREQVRRNIATFPTGFRYETVLKLGRYDFDKKVYPFQDTSQRINFNVFNVKREVVQLCVSPGMPNASNILPSSYRLVLDKPLSIVDLPLDVEEGKALVARMDASDNKEHAVYARINLRVTFVAPLDFSNRDENGKSLAVRSQVTQSATGDRAITLDSRLDSMEFFEDENFTRLIYKYRP